VKFVRPLDVAEQGQDRPGRSAGPAGAARNRHVARPRRAGELSCTRQL